MLVVGVPPDPTTNTTTTSDIERSEKILFSASKIKVKYTVG